MIVSSSTAKSDPRNHWLNTWQPQILTTEARTFPAEMYTSPEIFELEMKAIFGHTWYYVGQIQQLQGAGSYFTVEIAQQPLVIVRDKAGTLRGFFNVCPHRAGPVASGSGSCSRLTCLYHAWGFDLEGQLRSIPEMESAENFDLENHSLKAIQIDTWGPFIFVNLDPNAQPLANQLGELPDLFRRFRFDHWTSIHTVDYFSDINWKLYVENNVESYHELTVHDGYTKYHKQTVADARHTYYLQYAPLPVDDVLSEFMKPGWVIEGLSDAELNGKHTMSFFPNFALILRPYVAIIYLIDPISISRTRIRWEWIVPNPEVPRSPAEVQPLIDYYEHLQSEDLALLPSVQKGIHSQGYHQGRLSPKREMGTHLFQELIMRCLQQEIRS